VDADAGFGAEDLILGRAAAGEAATPGAAFDEAFLAEGMREEALIRAHVSQIYESFTFGLGLCRGTLGVDGVRDSATVRQGAPAEADFCQALPGHVISFFVTFRLESLAALPLYAVCLGDFGCLGILSSLVAHGGGEEFGRFPRFGDRCAGFHDAEAEFPVQLALSRRETVFGIAGGHVSLVETRSVQHDSLRTAFFAVHRFPFASRYAA